MDEMTKGEAISACFEYLSRCGVEIGNLTACVKDSFRKEIERRGAGLGFAPAGDWVEDYRLDESEWLTSDTAWSLPLKRRAKGRQSAKSFLTIQVSLWGDCLPPRGREPVVHVYCFQEACRFDEDDYYYAGFPLDVDDGDGDEQPVIEAGRCIVWTTNKESPWLGSWLYSIRLTAFSGQEAVKSLIVDPALSLLAGIKVNDALPDSLFDKGLIEYPDLDQLFEPRS